MTLPTQSTHWGILHFDPSIIVIFLLCKLRRNARAAKLDFTWFLGLEPLPGTHSLPLMQAKKFIVFCQ